ncbi:hypothetical protein E2986_11285 [Frieseomelitta varia]|uniref:NADH-ubiquinone oxidoreductase chain 1 n=1 Tax=Frieseomelitta varia TaxID=561572 RepID=A0A833RVV2_9HYME|nr:hypothetical protein E2986_11285 [Frieseomelitta varia]
MINNYAILGIVRLISQIISLLIDLNRIPFDLIEGESELVSGFNLEYYRRLFIYIFLSEYVNLLLIRIILLITFYVFNY